MLPFYFALNNYTVEKPNFFLTPNEIRNLFSDKITFYSEEEKVVSKMIVLLSFFGLYKQKDIMELDVIDINIESGTIKNRRYTNESCNVSEFIKLNTMGKEILNDYMIYRSSLSIDTNRLIVFNNKPIDNSGINSIFGIYNRVENRKYIHTKIVSGDLLIKSSILYQLTTQGIEGIVAIFKILEKSNAYYESAFEECLNIRKNESLDKLIQLKDLEDILPQNDNKDYQLKNYKREIESANKDIPKPEVSTLNDVNIYSVENDITIKDFEDFEMGNSNNKNEHKISIQRLVRDSAISRKLKVHYDYKCQVCSYRLPKSDGSYFAEAHHIQPYNKIHQGDDTTTNLIVLCPDCHAQFDDSYFAIHPETNLLHCMNEQDDYHLNELELKHFLDKKYLYYAWELFNAKKNQHTK